MAHYLVTGGCGFIGSHVADALIARGDHVRVLDNLSSGNKANLHSAAEFTEGDIADAQCVRAALQGCDHIIHLAAIASVQQCRDEWADSHRTNVLGTVTVFDEAARAVPRASVVYASSAAVYGDNPALPLNESETPKPLTSYGLDKWANEHYAAMAHRNYGVSSMGLRFFNVYGPRQDPSSPYSGVISLFANAARNNQPVTLFGDGLQSRDFIHVHDVVALILAASAHAAQQQGADVANGCSGSQTNLLDLIGALRVITGAALPITHAESRPGDIVHSLGDPALAKNLLGVQANISLEDGLRSL